MISRKPTIAFLAAGVDEQYQITVREGILEGIRQAGGRLVSIPGIPAFTGDTGKFRNFFAREIITPEIFDGIIILSTTFISYVSKDELLDLCRSFGSIPLVSLGLELPGVPSVSIDNGGGMEELMDHLFGFHAFRNPVFIGGPQDHPEAIERERVFIQALESYGIVPSIENIIHTAFSAGSGETAMKELLSRGSRFDCVVCANDAIALEAEAVLDEANLGTPVKAAITGFDDITLGRRQPFSLTTVHQPLRGMGFQGAAMMDGLLRGEVPQNRVLPTRLVVRETCGCRAAPVGPASPSGAASEYPETVRRQKDIKQARLLRMIGIRLLGAMDREEIRQILDTELRNLEAGYVGMIMIPEEERTRSDKRALLFAQFDPSLIYPDPSPVPFSLTGVFPPDFPDTAIGSCLVCPMNFGRENVGYLIFEEKPGILAIYYTLSLQLGNALKVWELEQKRQDYTKNLEAMIDERTRDLRAEVERRREAEQEVLTISDREQRRIGQDLHDDICQRLAGISILATAMDRGRTGRKDGASATRLSELMTDVIRRTKALSRGLFPVILDHQGLPAALEELAGIIDSHSGPACRFVFRGEGPMRADSPETLLHLYRIAQEASSNAVRHSRGGEIVIALADTGDRVILSIRDDGKGFGGGAPAGLGLSTMRYRAGFLGAELTIDSTENGTTVSCVLDRKEKEAP